MSSPVPPRQRAMIYVLHCGNMYGTERMALATLAGMDEYAERIVFAPSPGGPQSVEVAAAAAGYTCVRFDTRRGLVRELIRWFLRYRAIDLIGTGASEHYMAYGLSLLMGVSLRQLHVVHGGTEDDHAYGRKHHLNRIPVRLIAVSDFVRAKLLKHGVAPRAVTVIENFLPDAQRLQTRTRLPYASLEAAAKRAPAWRARVAVVSRIEPIKRIDLLVEAVEQHGLQDFHFDIYGTGDELETLRARTAAFPNIQFHGFVDDVNERLSSADFLLHLCPVEPFGLVILEAFLARVVVIVPDAGGAAGLVEQRTTGFRFKANDVADLCKVLEEARSTDATRLQSIAEAGHAALVSTFSQSRGLQRYREALSEPVRQRLQGSVMAPE